MAGAETMKTFFPISVNCIGIEFLGDRIGLRLSLSLAEQVRQQRPGCLVTSQDFGTISGAAPEDKQEPNHSELYKSSTISKSVLKLIRSQ